MSIRTTCLSCILIVTIASACDDPGATTTTTDAAPLDADVSCGPITLRGLFDDPGMTVLAPCGATHDLDTDVAAVLEKDVLEGSCDAHFARLDPLTDKLPASEAGHPQAIVDLVRCGKWMYLFAGLECQGPTLPERVLVGLHATFPGEIGPQWSALGMIADPDEDVMPIGLVPSPPDQEPDGITGRKMTFSCAACHAARLPDGRFAIGAGNTDLDLGKLNALGMFTLWLMNPDREPSDWPAETVAYYQQLTELLHASEAPEAAFFKALETLTPEQAEAVLGDSSFPTANESRSFLRGGRGRFNPFAPLIGIVDRQLFVTPPSIWDVVKYEDDVAAGRDAPAGEIAPYRSLEAFVRVGLYLTYLNPGADSPRYVDPVAAYVRTLRAPVNPSPREPERHAAGAALFAQACASCHDGKRGDSLAPYPLETVASPEAFRSIFVGYEPPNMQSALAYDWIMDVVPESYGTVDAVNARVLEGVWTRSRLMINGGVRGLDHLFCLGDSRGEAADASDPLTDAVHLDLCTDYDDDQKRDLIAFLSAW